jgi:hypothetical protein
LELGHLKFCPKISNPKVKILCHNHANPFPYLQQFCGKFYLSRPGEAITFFSFLNTFTNNEKDFKFTTSPLHRFCFAILLALFLPNLGFGQGTEYFNCPGYVPSPPSNNLPPSTTCDFNPEHPNFNSEPVIAIGLGTQFPNSSQLGNSITDNVLIVGNFTIDAPFAFENAVVAIVQNAQIIVQPSFNPFDPDAGLVIDNSDLFSCWGLWAGIVMQPNSIVNTRNNSSIQDAMIAIRAESSCSLFIQNTTFNRNWIGIDLIGNAVSAPNVWTFSGNHFNCTAFLKGTIQQTFAGVRLNNASLTTFGAVSMNWFRDLNFGIFAEGNLSNIGGRNLTFQRILQDGIYMENGMLHLIAPSTFTNCRGNGINIDMAFNVNINAPFIFFNNQLPPEPHMRRTGIRIRAFGLNSNVQIHAVNFSANMGNNNTKVRGIHLGGGIVSPGTSINIASSSMFSMRAHNSQAIFLDGEFPNQSITQIIGNHFRISTIPGDQSRPQGILADGGDKNNLLINANTFSAQQAGGSQWGTGIELRNSDGENNEVRGNSFSDVVATLLQYVIVSEFQNTRYCSNTTFGFGGWGYEFWGICTNTATNRVFEGNIITGIGYPLIIRPNALIGPQEHMGNQWLTIVPWYGPVFHAWCQSNSEFNKFTVHTPQSTCNVDPVCFFPFYPERVEADDMGEFFEMDNGTPSEACNGQLLGQGTHDLDIAIAQGLVPAPSDNPAQNWNLERYLFQKFKKNPSFVNEHASFPSFMNAKMNGSVGKFYDVHKSIQDAMVAGASVSTQSQQALANIALLMESLVGVDEQIQAAGNGSQLQALLQTKQGLVNQIGSLQTTYNSLYATYQIQVAANLQAAYTLNSSVSTAHTYEANEKAYNQIYLLSLMQQGGELTEAQVLTLQAIAQQDRKQGGPAVHRAWGLLPECARPEIAYEYLATPYEFDNPGQGGDRERANPNNKASTFSVYPNPTNASFTARGFGNGNGVLSLLDLNGRLLLSKAFSGNEVEVGLASGTPSGIYLLKISMDDGSSYVDKLTVQPK